MIYYVNVGENHHTICSQKSRKVWSIGGTGGGLWYIQESIWTHNNPPKTIEDFSSIITNNAKSCKVHRCPQYEIKWTAFIICDLHRGISWILLISFDLVWCCGIPCVHMCTSLIIIIYHGLSWPLHTIAISLHLSAQQAFWHQPPVSALPGIPGRMCPRNVWSPGGTGG